VERRMNSKGRKTMSLIPMNDYNNYEFCITSNNSVVRQARKVLNAVCIPRAEKEDKELEISIGLTGPMMKKKSAEKDYITCHKCIAHKIKKKYLKSTMKQLVYKTVREGRRIINIYYLCPACIKTYKPHSQRVGGKTY
jgi:hypothetical protein